MLISRSNIECTSAEFIDAGHWISVVDSWGNAGPIKIIFSIIKRRDLKKVVRIINHNNPNVFYTVENVQIVSSVVMPIRIPLKRRYFWEMMKMDWKRK